MTKNKVRNVKLPHGRMEFNCNAVDDALWDAITLYETAVMRLYKQFYPDDPAEYKKPYNEEEIRKLTEDAEHKWRTVMTFYNATERNCYEYYAMHMHKDYISDKVPTTKECMSPDEIAIENHNSGILLQLEKAGVISIGDKGRLSINVDSSIEQKDWVLKEYVDGFVRALDDLVHDAELRELINSFRRNPSKPLHEEQVDKIRKRIKGRVKMSRMAQENKRLEQKIKVNKEKK